MWKWWQKRIMKNWQVKDKQDYYYILRWFITAYFGCVVTVRQSAVQICTNRSLKVVWWSDCGVLVIWWSDPLMVLSSNGRMVGWWQLLRSLLPVLLGLCRWCQGRARGGARASRAGLPPGIIVSIMTSALCPSSLLSRYHYWHLEILAGETS